MTHGVDQYIDQVLTGQIPACRWVRLACERHVQDLEHGRERGLRYDQGAAEHVLGFFPVPSTLQRGVGRGTDSPGAVAGVLPFDAVRVDAERRYAQVPHVVPRSGQEKREVNDPGRGGAVPFGGGWRAGGGDLHGGDQARPGQDHLPGIATDGQAITRLARGGDDGQGQPGHAQHLLQDGAGWARQRHLGRPECARRAGGRAARTPYGRYVGRVGDGYGCAQAAVDGCCDDCRQRSTEHLLPVPRLHGEGLVQRGDGRRLARHDLLVGPGWPGAARGLGGRAGLVQSQPQPRSFQEAGRSAGQGAQGKADAKPAERVSPKGAEHLDASQYQVDRPGPLARVQPAADRRGRSYQAALLRRAGLVVDAGCDGAGVGVSSNPGHGIRRAVSDVDTGRQLAGTRQDRPGTLRCVDQAGDHDHDAGQRGGLRLHPGANRGGCGALRRGGAGVRPLERDQRHEQGQVGAGEDHRISAGLCVDEPGYEGYRGGDPAQDSQPRRQSGAGLDGRQPGGDARPSGQHEAGQVEVNRAHRRHGGADHGLLPRVVARSSGSIGVSDARYQDFVGPSHANLVLALGNSDGITAHPQGIADAVNNLAPASTPAAGSIGDHLDDLAAALAAATATLTVVSAVDGGELTIYQAVSFQATISGLSIPADWTKVYWTVKRATSEADTDAILQLVETNPGAGTDGLLRINGAAGTAANGTLTVNQAAGTVVIDLVMTICDDLALATGLVWSLKALHPTSASTLLAIGTVNVLGQATMAVA